MLLESAVRLSGRLLISCLSSFPGFPQAAPIGTSTLLQQHSPLDVLVFRIQGHAYAPGTMRNLHSQWSSFRRFCEQYGLALLVALPHTLSACASFLSCKTSSFPYIMNHLNSIPLLHRYRGFSADSFNIFDLALTKKGLKRILGTSSRQKHPITPVRLAAIGTSLDLTSALQAAIWALFTVTFFSFLRKSNLVAASAASFHGDRHLSRGDIKFTDSGAVLRIKWSKTRQHQEGIHIIPLPSIPHSSPCPVSALRRYFALVPASDTSPFFCLPSRRGSAVFPHLQVL